MMERRGRGEGDIEGAGEVGRRGKMGGGIGGVDGVCGGVGWGTSVVGGGVVVKGIAGGRG